MSEIVPRQDQNPVYETDTPVRYETDGPVAWITMDRPQFNNVQNSQMTYALDAAFRRATDDDTVKVIVPRSGAAWRWGRSSLPACSTGCSRT
ncbi:hypothetical protein J4558_08965 [Leptolyngbya sp. 15MV]|nr:hypothetical protein J4558_08965 [Leptolyngbya sp. 15MV]